MWTNNSGGILKMARGCLDGSGEQNVYSDVRLWALVMTKFRS